MAKLKLVADPTFSADVPIPRAGLEPSPVTFQFKHRDRDVLDKWTTVDLKERAESDVDPIENDLAMVKDVAIGWDLAETFNDENIRQLLKSYGGSAIAIYATYIEHLRMGKRKN